jgi:hypothetical protein
MALPSVRAGTNPSRRKIGAETSSAEVPVSPCPTTCLAPPAGRSPWSSSSHRQQHHVRDVRWLNAEPLHQVPTSVACAVSWSFSLAAVGRSYILTSIAISARRGLATKIKTSGAFLFVGGRGSVPPLADDRFCEAVSSAGCSRGDPSAITGDRSPPRPNRGPLPWPMVIPRLGGPIRRRLCGRAG